MITDPITVVEEAFITRIRALLGARVRKVESLPGDLDEETLKRMLIAAPGVYVSFGGGTKQGSANYAVIQSRWSVFVITGHASGQAARRTGDLVQIGAYSLTSILAGALDGWIPPLPSPPESGGDTGGVGTCELADVRNLFTGTLDAKGVALYGLTFTVPLEFPTEIDPATLADFVTFSAGWDLAPPDGTVDAADILLINEVPA